MAELTNTERLQPSLLDRLTDMEPDKTVESRDRRVLSERRLRKAVIRDLEWLLNSLSLSVTEDLEPYPEVEASVLNYGIPSLAGSVASSVDVFDVERQVKEAIKRFEPRLVPGTVQVNVIADSTDRRSLTFQIEADLWAETISERLYLRTEVDLETGQVAVKRAQRAG